MWLFLPVWHAMVSTNEFIHWNQQNYKQSACKIKYIKWCQFTDHKICVYKCVCVCLCVLISKTSKYIADVSQNLTMHYLASLKLHARNKLSISWLMRTLNIYTGLVLRVKHDKINIVKRYYIISLSFIELCDYLFLFSQLPNNRRCNFAKY